MDHNKIDHFFPQKEKISLKNSKMFPKIAFFPHKYKIVLYGVDFEYLKQILYFLENLEFSGIT